MTHDLKTSLEDLAEAEYADAPLSTIDIGRARADGRRRMLAARLAPIGGGVAVVAACALVVNTLGGTSPGAKPGIPATSSAAGHTFTGTDPLTAIAVFGWLPDGYAAATYSSGGDYGNSVTARTEPVPSSTPVTPSRLTLTAWATEPPLRGGETKKPVTVAGSQQAYLVTNPADAAGVPAELSLAWQTASGSWLTLGDYTAVHGAALEALLIKVAGSVGAGGAAVPLPIHIEGLPKDVALGEATLDNTLPVGKAGFTAGLSYHSGSSAPGGGRYFSITVAPIGQQPQESAVGTVPVPTALANPEVPVKTPDTCKDSDGLHICVQDDLTQPGPDPLASVGGAQGLLNRITSLGTDRANWTTHVVN